MQRQPRQPHPPPSVPNWRSIAVDAGSDDDETDDDWDGTDEDESDEDSFEADSVSELIDEIGQAALAMVEQLASSAGLADQGADLPRQEKLAEMGSVEIFSTDANSRVAGHIEADKIEQAKEELRQLGFHHVGDLVCSSLGHLAVLCFAGPAQMHAHLLVENFCTREFWTRFDNGDVLTTNNEENLGESDPELGHISSVTTNFPCPNYLPSTNRGSLSSPTINRPSRSTTRPSCQPLGNSWLNSSAAPLSERVQAGTLLAS